MGQSLFWALYTNGFSNDETQQVNAFKFNCSTKFDNLELIVCLYDVNDKTDIQQLLALK